MKSLKSQLRWSFALVGLIPLFLLGFFSYLNTLHLTKVEAQRRFADIAHQVVLQMERNIDRRKSNLQFLTRMLFVRETVVEQFDYDGLLAELLLAYQGENQEFSEIYLLKNTGKDFVPFASSNTARMGMKCDFTKTLQRMILEGGDTPNLQLSRESIVPVPGSENKAFRLIIPFRGEDEEIHFMVGLLDLEALGKLFESFRIGGHSQSKNQFMTVSDFKGRVLFSTTGDVVVDETKLSVFEDDTKVTLGAESYLLHKHNSELLNWNIYVFQNTAELFRWTQNLLLGMLFLLIALGVLVTLITNQQASRLSIPIENLKLAAQHFAQGNFDHKMPTTNTKEIQSVNTVFQDMAQSLKVANSELRFFNEELESQVESRTRELKDKNTELNALSSQLAKYLSPQLYNSIFQGKQTVQLGAKRKRLTIFFSDIKSFTTISEEMESEDLTQMLNAYLNEMAGIALKHGGTIDKFIGDAVMVFFGDPESQGEKDDALRCLQMALEMQERMKLLRKRWEKTYGAHQFHIRCGINTGYATVGNFGSDDRMDYTIVGRAVNLASRLESNAPVDGILISESTYSYVQDLIKAQQREPIQVKGIQKPVQTYAVEGFRKEMKSELLTIEADSLFVQADIGRMSDDAREQLDEVVQQLQNICIAQS